MRSNDRDVPDLSCLDDRFEVVRTVSELGSAIAEGSYQSLSVEGFEQTITHREKSLGVSPYVIDLEAHMLYVSTDIGLFTGTIETEQVVDRWRHFRELARDCHIREGEAAPRFQHARALAERLLEVRRETEHTLAEDDVEAPLFEGEGSQIGANYGAHSRVAI